MAPMTDLRKSSCGSTGASTPLGRQLAASDSVLKGIPRAALGRTWLPPSSLTAPDGGEPHRLARRLPSPALWTHGLLPRRLMRTPQQGEGNEPEHQPEDEMGYEERAMHREVLELRVRPRKDEIPHHEVQDGATCNRGGDVA